MDEKHSMMSFERLSENSADVYLYKHRVRSNIIYIIALATIVIAISLLPVIYVDITVSALGNIRPISEKTMVTASVTEIVDSVYVREGQEIQKGDIILTQRTLKIQNQQEYRTQLIQELDMKISDLKILTKGIIPKNFSSQEIFEKYNHYLSQRQQIVTGLEQYRIEWERNKSLFDSGLISESEYNKFFYQYVDKKNELTTIDRNQKSVWQNDLYNLQKERNECYSSDEDLKSEKQLYEVRCPVSGYIEQFNGIYKGSNISAGQQIAVISPDDSLCLDVFILPRDIAFIKLGQDVRIQIDALNYNEWGTLHGKVTKISSDMADDGNGNYYYKVKCALDCDFLTLRSSNNKAFVKKGMSANAHFIVTRQSLFTLIYRNIDEWANPTQYTKEK